MNLGLLSDYFGTHHFLPVVATIPDILLSHISALLLIYCEPSFDISEILVLGCGRNIEPINPEIRRFIRSTGMKLEAVDSVSKAVASPHFLVCCALAAYVVNKFAKEWHHNNSDGSNSNNNS